MNLSIVYEPAAWDLIVPGYAGGPAPVHNPARVAWSAQNSHAHPLLEFLFCLEGHTFMGTEGTVYTCSPATVFLFPPFNTHDLNYPPDTPDFDHLWVSFLADAVVINRHTCTNGHTVFSGHWQRPLSSTGLPDFLKPFNELWEGFDESEPALQRFRFHTAAVKIAEVVVDTVSGTDPLPDRDERQRMTVKNICAHIEHTGGAGATLDALAQVSGYSKYHFHRMFKEYAGTTLHAFVEQCRVKKARQLLKQGITKSETGYALGFSCPAAFSRWVRKIEL